MAVKTLRINIESKATGTEEFEKLRKTIEATGVEVIKFNTVIDRTGGLLKYNHSAVLATASLDNLKVATDAVAQSTLDAGSTFKDTNKVYESVTDDLAKRQKKVLASQVALGNSIISDMKDAARRQNDVHKGMLNDQISVYKERLANAKESSKKILEANLDTIRLERTRSPEGKLDTVAAAIVKQRQEEKALTAKVTQEVAKLDDAYAKQGITYNQYNGQRTRLTAEYRRELGKVDAALNATIAKEKQAASSKAAILDKAAAEERAFRAREKVSRDIATEHAIAQTKRRVTVEQLAAKKIHDARQLELNNTFGAIAVTDKATKANKGLAGSLGTVSKALKVNHDHNQSFIFGMLKLVSTYDLVRGAIRAVKAELLAIPQAGIAMQSNIAALTGTFGSGGARKELAFVSELADKYGQDLASLETSFTKFAPSAKLAGATLAEVNQIFDDFTAVGTVLHKTPDQMQAVFLALEQMFAKGVVQSEEIKKQLGNQLPAAVEIAAEAVKRTPAAFMEAMKKNQIIASEAVPKIAALYREIYAPEKVLTSVSTQLLANYNRLITNITVVNREFFSRTKDTMNSVLQSINKGIAKFMENLKLAIQLMEVFITLVTTRVITAVAALTLRNLDLATSNTRVAFSYLGLNAAISTASKELGLFLGRLTGLPPSLLLVSSATAGVVAGLLAIGGARLKFDNAGSSMLEKEVELTEAWGSALIEQTKTSEETSTKLKESRELAVELANQALDDFDTVNTKANGFFISVGDKSVEVAGFFVAGWQIALENIALETEHSINKMKGYWEDFKSVIPQADTFIEEIGNTLKAVDPIPLGKGLIAAMNEAAAQEHRSGPLTTDTTRTVRQNAKDIYDAFVNELVAYSDTGGTVGVLEDTVGSMVDRAYENEKKALADKLEDLQKQRQDAFEKKALEVKDQEVVEAAAIKSAQDKYYKLNKVGIENLKQLYSDNRIGITEYYSKVRLLREEDIKSTEEALNRQIKAAKAEGKLQKALDLDRKKKDKVEGIKKDIVKDTREQEQAIIDLANAGVLASIALAELQGEASKAAKLKFSIISDQELKALQNIDSDPVQAITLQANKELVYLKQQQAIASTELGRREAIISSDVVGGLESQIGAMLRLTDTRKIYIDQQQALINQMASSGSATSETIRLAQQELDNFKKTANEVEQFSRETLQGSLASSFEGFITGADSAGEAMRKFATGVIDQIARIAAQQLAQQIIGGLFSLASPTLSAAGTPGSATFVGPVQPGTFAKGGVASGMSSASGSILTKATHFPNATPLAKGGVVAGEAGAEVVLPLERNSQGVLGVKSSGGGGSSVNIGSINVTVSDKKDSSAAEQSDLIGKAIAVQVKAIVQKELVVAQRRGNSLNPTKINKVF